MIPAVLALVEEKELVNFYYSLLTEKIDGSNYTRDILQQHFDLCVVDFMRSLPQRSMSQVLGPMGNYRGPENQCLFCGKSNHFIARSGGFQHFAGFQPLDIQLWLLNVVKFVGQSELWPCSLRMAAGISRRAALLGHVPLMGTNGRSWQALGYLWVTGLLLGWFLKLIVDDCFLGGRFFGEWGHRLSFTGRSRATEAKLCRLPVRKGYESIAFARSHAFLRDPHPI